jgi:hypothetical protein
MRYFFNGARLKKIALSKKFLKILAQSEHFYVLVVKGIYFYIKLLYPKLPSNFQMGF